MIITKLKGGLGNQMFQYAIGVELACRNDTSLKLDITEFSKRKNTENPHLRSFELGAFTARLDIASVKELSVFIHNNNTIQRVVNRVKRELGLIQIRNERSFRFEPGVLQSGANTYLSGYWQCEKYFTGSRDLLLKSFELRRMPDEYNLRMAEAIRNCNAVSLHVRRGDYLSDPLSRRIHGICGTEYYRKAAEWIGKKTSDPTYFIFSDDIQWCKTGLSFLKNAIFVDGNLSNPSADLHLMANCRHHIIANSSLGWWGAWLDPSLAKLVIAPRQWFADPAMNESATDVVPASWMRL